MIFVGDRVLFKELEADVVARTKDNKIVKLIPAESRGIFKRKKPFWVYATKCSKIQNDFESFAETPQTLGDMVDEIIQQHDGKNRLSIEIEYWRHSKWKSSVRLNGSDNFTSKEHNSAEEALHTSSQKLKAVQQATV